MSEARLWPADIGVARAVLIVMENAKILDTAVNALSIPLEGLSPVFAALGMFLPNGVLNFLVPSGSGQAMIAMPILSPLADMVGITCWHRKKTTPVKHRGFSLVFHLLGGLGILFFISPVFTLFSIIAAFLFWVCDSYLLETVKRRRTHQTKISTHKRGDHLFR